MAEEQLVVFSLHVEDRVCEYGVSITQVQEIIRFSEITSLPQCPDFMEGVINLRGKVIPVIDLKKYFGMGSVIRSEGARIIVFDLQGHRTGIMVDDVAEVVRLNSEAIEPAPQVAMSGASAQYLKGIGKLENRLIIVINLNNILGQEQILTLQQIA